MVKPSSIFVETLQDNGRSSLLGQRDGEAAAAQGRILDPYLAAVHGNDLAHEGETETVALGFMRAVPLIEFVKNARLILIRDRGALVVDGEENAPVLAQHPHPDEDRT